MKVIIAGSRFFEPTNERIDEALREAGYHVTEVVSGTARGPDEAGERWAAQHSIPVRRFPADWGRYGLSAGPRRNVEMARYADAALLFWDGSSRGTQHMLAEMTRLGKPCFVVQCQWGVN